MTSHIPHTQLNVVFLDYDYTSMPKIIKIVKTLQNKYGLGVAHIAHTGPTRHHVVFLDKVDTPVWIQIVKESNCHDGYLFHLKGQEYAILRLIQKGRNPAPFWVCSVKSDKPTQNKQSLVHGLVLSEFWDMPQKTLLSMYDNRDSNLLWEEVYYWTDNVRNNLKMGLSATHK